MTSEQFTALYAQVQVHTYQMERVMADVSEIRESGAAQVSVEKLERDVAAMMKQQRQIEAELRAMSDPTPTPPTPMGFWPTLLGAISAPLETWNKLRMRSQFFLVVLVLFALTVLTDGGRELIAATLGGAADVAENVADKLRGDELTPDELTPGDNPPAAMPPPEDPSAFE